ncbi:MAG: hypothetical protein FWE34_06780 [Defluviitaleaceae bacterium]|nr:hypothetical protein [Defluviitaleaceae bacterium]
MNEIMSKVKTEYLMLATRICAGVLILLFFLPWISVVIPGFGSESANGWTMSLGTGEFGDDVGATPVALSLLLLPLALLVVTFLQSTFQSAKQFSLILVCVAGAGFLFMIISHVALGSTLTDPWLGINLFAMFATFFFYFMYFVHIAALSACVLMFLKGGTVTTTSGSGMASPSPQQSSTVFCNKCGATCDPSVSKFCNNCGNDLTA